MTRNDVLLMLAKGGLEAKFEEVDKSYELTIGELPKAYVVPQWIYDVLNILQKDTPKWKGRRLDPWDKDELRGAA